jgi:2'-5' RNA ligase
LAEPAPLIVTLAFDPASAEVFEGLRRRHFPPERNLIPAHLTLFHALPGGEEADVRATLSRVSAVAAAMRLEVVGPRKLGRGVALDLRSPELNGLRAELARAFEPWLTPQDRQGFRPHVTVQNKVDPRAASALFDQVSAGFRPWTVTGEGLLLWRYLGGPWEPLAFFGFSDAVAERA